MEFDLVNNPHPHPLIYYRRGKPDGVQQIRCTKCKELFCPPAFVCSDADCIFNIHQSCIDLPPKIHSPFHSHDSQVQTSLLLQANNSNECTCCNHQPFDAMYKCDQNCGFLMDVQCAIANPKAGSLLKMPSGQFRHFSHNFHSLALRLASDQDQRRITIRVCLVCKRPIKSPSTYYFCPEFLSGCDSYTFHQKCAELPRQIFNSLSHPHHPFVLLAKQPFSCICFCCKTECTDFFYSCPPCKFNLHVHCLWLFDHKHDFSIFAYRINFRCILCDNSNTAFPWFCTLCNLLAHESCAIHYHMCQDQVLSSSPQISNISDHDDLGNEVLQHFSHDQHKLTLIRLREDTLCDGCMRCITFMSESYACPPCGFYLHKQCATLPTQHNSYLHSHELTMVYIPDFVFSCALCIQYCHGFAYRCKDCCYTIDIRCAAVTFPFKHPSHPAHLLTYYDGETEDKLCNACEEKLTNKRALWCEECKFYLDVRCAHLPHVVMNRFDEHPLILAFANHGVEIDEVGYHCDLCEEERNEKGWFYECRMCCFGAHTKCILGDYPFLKSAKFKNHMHPLTLVNECTKRYSSRPCDKCKESCGGKLVFQCGNSNCKFNLHASGKCYIQHLIQEQMTFTMPSLRYRSISLHPDQKWKLTSSTTMKAKVLEKHKCPITLTFLSQGIMGGEHWDDGVFSSIRALRIYVDWWIGIQMEYEDEDGNSIWKDKHGPCYDNKGFLTEVTLDHPDEYLTSLHGSYSTRGIRSLSFETNQRTLGPYERVTGEDAIELIKFPPSTGLKIVGLHGRRSIDGDSLTAIGFHFIEI